MLVSDIDGLTNGGMGRIEMECPGMVEKMNGMDPTCFCHRCKDTRACYQA